MSNFPALYVISGSSADGSLQTDEMRWQFDAAYISVLFYSDAELTNIVTPGAGTITFEASEDGTNWGSITNGIVDPTATYLRPNFLGTARFVRGTTSGITVASFYKATVYRGYS